MDNWNSGYHDQGFLSAFFTLSDAARGRLRMKTLPTEASVLSSSLQQPQFRYFFERRRHIFETIHLSTAKPWRKSTNPNHPLVCDMLQEWKASVAGMETFGVAVKNDYLRNCFDTGRLR